MRVAELVGGGSFVIVAGGSPAGGGGGGGRPVIATGGSLAMIAAIALSACKSEGSAVPPPSGGGSGSPSASAQSGSSAPVAGSGSAAVVLAPKIVSGELAAMIPTVPSAKVLSTKAPNEAYALATWCIDEADAVARVKSALEGDGWTNVHTRGEAPRIAIAAMKGDVRFSGRTGGSDTRCAGTYVTATVMRLGNIDAKLLEGADKIR